MNLKDNVPSHFLAISLLLFLAIGLLQIKETFVFAHPIHLFKKTVKLQNDAQLVPVEKSNDQLFTSEQ